MCPISRAYCLPHLSASRDLQTSGCAGNAVLALNALDVNPKVELVHSRYDRLRQFRECPHVVTDAKHIPPCFRGCCGPERQVFLVEPVQCTTKNSELYSQQA